MYGKTIKRDVEEYLQIKILRDIKFSRKKLTDIRGYVLLS